MTAGVELTQSAAKGDLKMVRRLLAGGTPPNSKNAHGMTALHFAAAGGHIPVIVTLLNRGASVDAKAGDGYTPLCKAAEAGQGEVVALLMVSGATQMGCAASWLVSCLHAKPTQP
jgi:ankyrin repeat protein